ncbi:MAG: NAD(P)-dependent oxidoreductase [Betaproteobacteria bacterium]|nr:MAG: NAD(P)-dependent oxidoreductase [Betaproteobacteria bacterium]
MNPAAGNYPVGFVGIGKMGLPMATRIAQHGHPLHAYDTSTAALGAIGAVNGVRASAGLAGIGRACAVVILMLPDSAVVRKVLYHEKDGLAAHLRPGAVVIDMSSSVPSVTRELGGRLKAAGIDLIDAPVSGGVKRAIDGSLAIMAGGEPAVIERLKPLLLTMGKSIVETGMLGSGHAMKALNNYVSAAGLLAACEALKVGADFGIAPDKIVAVLNASTGRNNSTENKLMQFVVSGEFNSGFSLGLMKKDINIATDLALDLGSETLLGEVLLRSWADAEVKFGGAADHTEIYRMLERGAESNS